MTAQKNTSPLAQTLSAFTKLGLVLTILILIGLGIWVTSSYMAISEQADKIAQAAGAPQEISKIVGGPFFVMLAFPATFILISLWVHSIFSFRSPWKAIGRIALVMIVVMFLALLPTFIGFFTNTDQSGGPRVMRRANPGVDRWFAPNGTPEMYYSREANGTLRFWKDEGYTPDTRILTQPVTPDTLDAYARHIADEEKRQDEARKAAEIRRNQELSETLRKKEAENKRLAAETRRLREEHMRREAEERFNRSWKVHSIYSGRNLNMYNFVNTDFVQIDTQDRLGVRLDGGREIYLGPGLHMVELNGAQNMSIRSRRSSNITFRVRTLSQQQVDAFLPNK